MRSCAATTSSKLMGRWFTKLSLAIFCRSFLAPAARVDLRQLSARKYNFAEHPGHVEVSGERRRPSQLGRCRSLFDAVEVQAPAVAHARRQARGRHDIFQWEGKLARPTTIARLTVNRSVHGDGPLELL